MKGWAWILIGGGTFTMVAGWLASRAKAQTTTTAAPGSTRMIGGFFVPIGVNISTAEYNALLAVPEERNGAVHHDFQEAFNMYLLTRQADGSATINGVRYASLQAVLAAAAQG